MNLGRSLFFTFIKIFIITSVITVMVGALFVSLCPDFKSEQKNDPCFILTENGSVLRKSRELDLNTVNDIKMTLLSGSGFYILNNIRYRITEEEMGDGAQIIQLMPLEENRGMDALFKTLLITFVISFFSVTEFYRHKIKNELIFPLGVFSDELKRLIAGEISAPVSENSESEISSLFSSLEMLRIKLKDAVYYKKQIDDNRSFLMSSISHDLKTPVTAVKGYLEGVLDGIADTEEKRNEYLLKAAKKTDLISVMIDDLLYFSKLDLKQIPFNFKKISVCDFVSYAVSDNAQAFGAENKSISFVNKLSSELLVLIDEEKFQRVAQNVIDNARKYTLPGGSLVITLTENNGSVILEFKDDGVGISGEDISHVFDKFYRGDSARKIEGSSGLGLAIAKQITEGMGGRIWATSKENEGTSIMISLSKA